MSEPLQKEGCGPGFYRHYKGGLYEVLGVAQHSETLEHLVVYRPCGAGQHLWVRPLSMFVEQITHEGRLQPRFSPVAHGPEPHKHEQ